MAGVNSAQIRNGHVYPTSDRESEEQLREAIDASNDHFALTAQLQEILPSSDFMFAYELQLSTLIDSGSSITFSPFDPSASASSSSSSPFPSSSSSPFPSSSSSSSSKEGNDYLKVDLGVGGLKGKAVDTGFEAQKCISYRKPESVPCGICFEDSLEEMFEGLQCLHRFCHACMTRFIHSRVEQKRHQIYCPHDTCGEALTLQECRYFLPDEILDAWSVAILEADIPVSDKVYCPFPDCSAPLVKENVGSITMENMTNAECPFCYRMFCVRCMVPWHADLQCSEFQNLPPAERSQADLQLLKLAHDRKWQRCENCKGIVELAYGCNHITCRCGYEFCYVCGRAWANECPNCSCPRITENHILR